MKKITDLTETRWRTVHLKDENGNRYRDTEEYLAYRKVKSISPGPRVGHFIIDCIAFQIMLQLIQYIISLLVVWTNFNVTLSLTFALISGIIVLVSYPLYYTIFEYYWQRTPGKYLTSTLVIDEFGNKPGLQELVLRNCLRLVPFEPFSCFDSYSRGWHDSWSNTWVVTEAELSEIKKLQASQVITEETSVI